LEDRPYDFSEMRQHLLTALDHDNDPKVWEHVLPLIETLDGLMANPEDPELNARLDRQMEVFNAFLVERQAEFIGASVEAIGGLE
jgi:hypothetical protein